MSRMWMSSSVPTRLSFMHISEFCVVVLHYLPVSLEPFGCKPRCYLMIERAFACIASLALNNSALNCGSRRLLAF